MEFVDTENIWVILGVFLHFWPTCPHDRTFQENNESRRRRFFILRRFFFCKRKSVKEERRYFKVAISRSWLKDVFIRVWAISESLLKTLWMIKIILISVSAKLSIVYFMHCINSYLNMWAGLQAIYTERYFVTVCVFWRRAKFGTPIHHINFTEKCT